jgi:outer membrane protein assembly factor BamB
MHDGVLIDRRTFLTVALAAPLADAAKAIAQTQTPVQAPALAWTQWGGPNRNFHTDARGISNTWPAGGPRVVWKRPLGEGYSSPSVENGVLYVMYGKPREEVVMAADAETGKTLWEHATAMTFQSDAAREMGNGPYSTPLVVGSRLFTTGVAGRLQCLDKKSGKVLWTQELWDEHRGSQMMYGYASSPIGFRQTVIVPVGGRGRAIMAFQQTDGKVAWSAGNLGNVYSSPILINVSGLEQLAMLLDGAVVSVNPHNGDPQWQVPFKAEYSIAVATPVWGSDNLMFISSEYNGGTKVIEITRNGLQTTTKELWSSNRLRLHHGNAMRIDNTIYFSNGGKGSQAILTAVDARSGTIHWQQRTIEKATFVWADQKLITLDQDGNLMIAHPSPKDFTISAKAPLLTRLSWTPPTLVGTRLYIRDRKTMMAVDLS